MLCAGAGSIGRVLALDQFRILATVYGVIEDDGGHTDAEAQPKAIPMNTDGRQPSVDAVTERREHAHHDQTPAALFERLPGALVLNRLAVPVLAVDRGVVVYANTAFAEMVGMSLDILQGSSLGDLLTPGENASSPFSRVIRFRHTDGFTVRALASRSLLVRAEDSVALVSFTDVTEQMWETGPSADES